MASETKDPPKRARRPVSRGFFVCGLIVGAVVPALAYQALRVWAGYTRDNVDVTSIGRDVSRHGGAMILIRDERGVIRQTCNGACDDLRFRMRSGDNVFQVNVLDAAGKCVACDEGAYVTPGLPVKWRVSGENELNVKPLRDSSLPSGLSNVAPVEAATRPAAK